MNQAEPKPPPPAIDRRYLQTRNVVLRPPAERPTHETIDGIADWLVGDARQIESVGEAFDEFAWRMLATGLPLLRVTTHAGTLHPQFLGTAFHWWRTTGQTTHTMIAHEAADGLRYEDNPVRRVCVGGETLRRRLEVADDQLDFPILHELKAAGATDYLALPVPSAHGLYYMVTFVTDRKGGFSPSETAT